MKHRGLLSISLISLLLVVAPASARGKDADARGKPAPAQRAQRGTPGWHVAWGGSWWRAEILERKSGLTKIHYTGWGSEWDEWVEPNRVRRAPPDVPVTNGRVGQKVSIEWQGSFWDGEIIATRSGLSKVHYSGWGSEWDEWVEPARLRAR
jgi:hypothetical protein